jgi:hypothetical protein
MSVGHNGDVTDDLVLRTWQVITLLGEARECSEEAEQPELSFTLAKVETVLPAIVSKMAKRASRSKRQRRPGRIFGNAADDKLSPRGSGWRDCPTPSPPDHATEAVASALVAAKRSPRISWRCASAAALARATIEKVSSSIRSHETAAPDNETVVGTLSSRLAYPKADCLSRSAGIDYSDAGGLSRLTDQIGKFQPNPPSLKNDDPRSYVGAPRGLDAEAGQRLTMRRGVSIGSPDGSRCWP